MKIPDMSDGEKMQVLFEYLLGEGQTLPARPRTSAAVDE